jgi:hypothetical protein
MKTIFGMDFTRERQMARIIMLVNAKDAKLQLVVCSLSSANVKLKIHNLDFQEARKD